MAIPGVSNTNESIENAKKWIFDSIENTPLITKFLVIITSIGSLTSLAANIFSLNAQSYIWNSPRHTILNLQIYRIFTSWLLPSSFFGGIFQVITLYPLLKKIENKKGSVFLLINCFVLNSVTQAVFVLFCAIFGFGSSFIFSQFSVGMWVIFFNLLPIILTEPFQERGVPFFGVKLPAVIYPFALCLFFQLFGLELDIMVAAILAHLSHHKYKLLRNLSVSRLQSIEKWGIVGKIRVMTKGFVVADVSEYHGLPFFIPFTGKSMVVGGNEQDNDTFVQEYKPNGEIGNFDDKETNEKEESSYEVPSSGVTDSENEEVKCNGENNKIE